jgi:two-component system, chemotaxis family, chemotaxis protein CheY
MTIDISIPVLVVEDMPIVGRLICGLLKQVGFQHVDLANGSYPAINRLRTSSYGLVISDWDMRPVTGLDLLKQIRAEAALADTPFIMITASSSPDLIREAKNAGADEFLPKPFTVQTLRETIARVFAKRAAPPDGRPQPDSDPPSAA